jgi:small subunit ribosomal protein S18
MAKTKPKAKVKRKVAMSTKCYFCENETEPNYLGVDVLKRFVSDRGRIYGRDYSGVCNKHQKRLAKSVKRARHLALLPFKAVI